MKNMFMIILFCSTVCNLKAQRIILGQNAYIVFVRDSCTELYSQYTCSKNARRNIVTITKLQYIYRVKERKLVATKATWKVPLCDFPDNFVNYSIPNSCDRELLVKAYNKPSHDFENLRKKVQIHFGYALE